MTGRPAWIPTDSICEQAREMASRGLTVSQIADCLGISESTLYAKQGEYTEFVLVFSRDFSSLTSFIDYLIIRYINGSMNFT